MSEVNVLISNYITLCPNSVYTLDKISGNRTYPETKMILSVGEEGQLTWSKSKGNSYTFIPNSKGTYILTKSSFKGGGSGPIPVNLCYELEVFTWTEIKTGSQYIFTPGTDIDGTFNSFLF